MHPIDSRSEANGGVSRRGFIKGHQSGAGARRRRQRTSLRLIVRQATLDDRVVSYTLCRVLPDTALVLRDVLREAARLWARHLGATEDAHLRQTSEGEAFFTGRVRLEPVPPERQMVAVWLPLPPDFDAHVRPQLIDFIESFDPQKGMQTPPEGWPGWTE